jgi:hypothetical protein
LRHSGLVRQLCLFALGVAFACRMASTFGGDGFPNMGVVTGIVGLAGALGGLITELIEDDSK